MNIVELLKININSFWFNDQIADHLLIYLIN